MFQDRILTEIDQVYFFSCGTGEKVYPQGFDTKANALYFSAEEYLKTTFE